MDDIDYLKANSQKHSYMFYVDSAKRNRGAHPDPNQYQVVFNTPLRNVYSIQVLDASVPRTHYNVDTNNNRLYYQITTNDVIYEKYIDVDIGDYNNKQLLDALNSKLQPDGISVEFLSTPAERRKQFIFKSEHMFSVCTSKSSMRSTLGFDEGAYNLIESVDDPTYYDTYTVLDTLGNNNNSVPINAGHVLYQRFVATKTGDIKNIRFGVTDIDSGFDCKARVFDRNMTLLAESEWTTVTPNMTLVSIDAWLSGNNPAVTASEEYYVSINTSGQPTFSVYMHIVSSANAHSLYIHPASMTDPFSADTCSGYMASLYVVPGIGTNVAKTYFGVQTVSSALTLYLGMNMQISVESRRWSLIPPGIYNLVGDRYVLLRCKEIESHILSSIKSFDVFNPVTNTVDERQYETGIAKFKMGVVGYREERFDFNTLPPYEFHPIGKLSALTFVFENPDGRPYNFRGVNHTVTLVVNYYKPVVSFTERNALKSKLYPEYDPLLPIFKTDDDIYDINN